MSESTELRIRRLVREVLTVHLDAFLILLAEAAVSADQQRQRLDALVRALIDIGVEESLTNDGRPVAVVVDPDRDPPRIRLHRKLIEGVDDAEVLRAFQQPVADILDISPITVGLVLQCRDDRQLKSLANTAARRCAGPRAQLTEVAAVVEQRLALFEQRLSDFAAQFGDSVFLLLSGKDEFLATLSRAGSGWPDWARVESSEFMVGAIDQIDNAVDEVDDVPTADLLVELCWESLDLSGQSFLRQAARKLRAHHCQVDVDQALASLMGIVDDGSASVSSSLDDWSAYAELSDAWEQLFHAEQRILAWTPGLRECPTVSVLEPPGQTMGLSEPDSLPWDWPLLAWSMREQRALRDLLVGLRRGLEDVASSIGHTPVALSADATTPPLETDVGHTALQAKVVAGEHNVSDQYGLLLDTAMSACHRAVLAQFDRLDQARQQRVLGAIRSAYDGFFGNAKAVWARRFQAWKNWDKRRAFTVLATEIRHILGPAIYFDPFQHPRETQLRAVPTFNVVVPRPENADRVTVSIPLAALRNTFQDTPVRLRVVDVFDMSRCVWSGDLDVTLDTVEQYPTETVLESVENDSVGMMVYESLMSTGRIG